MSGGGGECLCVWLPGGCFGGGGVSAREVVLVVVVLAKARWLCLGEVCTCNRRNPGGLWPGLISIA